MSEPVHCGADILSSRVVGEIFWAMDHPDDDDGEGGVREPRRPLDSPPSLVAEADPSRE